MKKLFSSMLAATMVAGMGVTAFAANLDGYTQYDNKERKDFSGQDYALIGAYDEDGKKVGEKDFVDGGDKIYFPILVCGEELDDEAGKDEEMFFVTKRSDIDDLKASVKDEIGGKYIDNADIVKKDINIDNVGSNGTYKKGNKTVTAAELKAKLGDEFTVSDSLTGGATNVGAAPSGLIIKKGQDTPATWKDYTVKLVAAPGTNTKKNTVEASESAGTITVTVYGGYNTGSSSPEEGTDVSATDIKTAIENAITAEATKEVEVTGNAQVSDTGKFLKETTVSKAKGQTAAPVSAPTYTSTVQYKQSTASNKEDAGTYTVTKDDAAKTVTIVITGTNKFTSATSMGKVYCVEVEMADYYKSEETEVEFNIKLKNSGRTEFDSEDDAASDFVAEFDLGQDSEELVNNESYVSDYEVDFDKDGDLELEIGPDTRSVQLDEAKVKADEKSIDIETIFLESADEIDCAFTFDVKASNQDDLYLELNDDAVKDLAVSNQKADLTFFNFPGEPEFDFSGDATFAVEDDDEDYYFYEIVDGELVETNAKYDSRDGVFKLRTNKLGSYVISDKELDTAKEEDEKDVNDDETKTNENGGGDATADAATPSKNAPKANANTGAADLIGVASALAVVSVAAAGAVALKK